MIFFCDILEENARLALYWLIKSSEQGNDEATKLLEECLRSGKGIKTVLWSAFSFIF